jgi:ADP-ribosylglycohydrolase
MEMSLEEFKFKSAILGGVVGDSLGVPVEFRARSTYYVDDMIGYGTYNQPPGTWSDDTSLTMCLIENLIHNQGQDELMKKFVAYKEQGYWTPYGEMFDIGRATDDAIYRYTHGAPAHRCGGSHESDNGNGALMRIAPLAFVLQAEDSSVKIKQMVEKWCEVTHRHARSHLGCIFYITFLMGLIHDNHPIDALEKAILFCNTHLRTESIYRNEFHHYEAIFNQSFLTWEQEQVKSDGYVVHSLEAALWCFFKHNSYKGTVLEAVNLGEDTDTISAIAGTMAGLKYGLNGIPEGWLLQLVHRDKIALLCDQFVIRY